MKSQVADISRAWLDKSDSVSSKQPIRLGIDEQVVRDISAYYREPSWMLDLRLRSLEVFFSKDMPTWGPSLSELHIQDICFFATPEGGGNTRKWEEVPDAIKNTFERLGIPDAEKEFLAGVGAQYDSEVVYHNLRQELQDQGVIFLDMSEALRSHEEIVKKHFMKAVPIYDHTFAALHGAVWSGGTFLFVPKGVQISSPLQAYFRMNLRSGGQFEHTLIVVEDAASVHYIEGCSAPKYNTTSLHAGCVEIYGGKNSHIRYSSVENWSTDTYNLNTKRAIIQEGGAIEWVGGNLGSGKTMLYPCSVLQGDYSSALHFGIAFANTNQEADTGAKVIHIGKYSSSEVISKSLSKGGGISTYRGLVDVKKSAVGAVAKIDCDGLILDSISQSITIPDIRVASDTAMVAHEASVGKINEDTLFYLQSRGISEEDARTLIVRGFVSPLLKELPLEYASEMNILIEMEMEGL